MAGRTSRLVKQLGAFLVAAELAQRCWLAVRSGNTPDFVLIATGMQGG